MITHLDISGLALIDQLSVEFSGGFNVITGETGAGKSILMKALNLLLGNKASQDLIRSGCKSASVCAIFEVEKNHPVRGSLSECGIEASGAIVLRRMIQEGGRTQAWVNDIPVTLPTLKEISRQLIDIFSQHENQRLMDASTHVTYIDRLGDLSEVAKKVAGLHGEIVALVKNVESIAAKLEKGAENIDYLKFRLAEIEKFAPSLEDFETLTSSVKERELNAQNRELLAECVEVLTSDDGALIRLKDLSKRLAKLPVGLKGELSETVDMVLSELEEFSYVLEQKLSSDDEGDLAGAQGRLYKYQELIRKSATRDIAGVFSERERLQGEVRFLEEAEGQIHECVETIRGLLKIWTGKACDLSKRRRLSAKTISAAIAGELNELAMAGATFDVRFGAAGAGVKVSKLAGLLSETLEKSWGELEVKLLGVTSKGIDSCEFVLSANPGEELKPLGKIASGGELSRIMLALKKVLLSGADTCVMVFDEIDSGISGRVADIVGQKIRELSQSHQVLCISHLPQVSVYADAHLQVKKAVKNERTESSIVKLSPDQSAREIARMLSGDRVSTSSLENARSLMAKAQKLSQKLAMVSLKSLEKDRP